MGSVTGKGYIAHMYCMVCLWLLSHKGMGDVEFLYLQKKGHLYLFTGWFCSRYSVTTFPMLISSSRLSFCSTFLYFRFHSTFFYTPPPYPNPCCYVF
jgi:hypothetical protein